MAREKIEPVVKTVIVYLIMRGAIALFMDILWLISLIGEN